MAGFSRDKYRTLAKGFYGRAKKCLRSMGTRVDKALQYSYRDRKARRRTFRREWIQTINAATREHDTPYGRFIAALTRSNISLDRKILANLAINEPYSFKAVLDEAKLQTQAVTAPHSRRIDALEAYAKKLIIDGDVKPLPFQEEPLPYFFGKRATLEEDKKKYQQQALLAE